MSRLSKNKNYINYMVFKVNGDFGNSIIAMNACIKDVEGDPNAHLSKISFLLQELGTLKYLNGEIKEAFELYERSLIVDKDSLLAELRYAKFLARECMEFEKAIGKCDFIIETTTNSPFLESEEDFGSNYYLQNAQELKSEILARVDRS
ncbi:MAG: hypothetical protein NVS3B3_15860 [Aquirhabdus sp.]